MWPHVGPVLGPVLSIHPGTPVLAWPDLAWPVLSWPVLAWPVLARPLGAVALPGAEWRVGDAVGVGVAVSGVGEVGARPLLAVLRRPLAPAPP